MITVTPNSLRGISWMLFQGVVFVAFSLITRFLAQSLPVFEIFFLSVLTAWIWILPWLFYTKGTQIRTTTAKWYIARALFAMTSTCTWFYALQLAPITEVTAISYTAPLFTCLLAVWLLKEHIGPHRIAALIAGFIGALIILHPSGSFTIGLGALLALITAVLWAFCDILIKRQLQSDHYHTQIFYMVSLMTLGSMPLALWQWQTPTWEQCGWIMAAGLCYLLNFHSLFRAYHYADLTVVMPFDFSRLIWTSIAAYFLFGETLTTGTLIGSLIIVSSTVYIAYREKIRHRLDSFH